MNITRYTIGLNVNKASIPGLLSGKSKLADIPLMLGKKNSPLLI